MARKIILDPDGDVCLRLQDNNGNEPHQDDHAQPLPGADDAKTTLDLIVSSKIMATASPVFKSMFYGKFKEGTELAACQASSALYIQELPEDDTEAAITLCALLHFNDEHVVDDPVPMFLVKLADLACKYLCVRAVHLPFKLWLKRQLEVSAARQADGDAYSHPTYATKCLCQCLYVAYILDFPEEYATIFNVLVLNDTGTSKHTGNLTNCLDKLNFRHNIRDRLAMQRSQCLARIYDKMAIAKIKEETPNADVSWKECDLGSLATIRNVFTEIREELDRLDFFVGSAGINTNKFELDADGIDRHFGVNVLGHFYAVNQLWPLIRKTSKMPGVSPPRIVFEASEMHRTAPSDVKFASLEEINTDIGPTHLYGRTKLALILLAKFGLAEKVIKKNNDHIYALSVHPGAVNTAMQQQWKDAYPGITGTLLTWAMLAFGRSVEQGSYSALWALTSPDVEKNNYNGWYFNDPATPGKESAQASDPQLGNALWTLCENTVKKILGDDALQNWDIN